MKSLTFRIFAWYWAASIVTVGGFYLWAHLAEPSSLMERWKAVATSAVPLLEQGAVRVYESDGPAALLSQLEPERLAEFRTYLPTAAVRPKNYFFGLDAKELTGRDPGDEVRAIVRKAVTIHQLVMKETAGGSVFAWHLKCGPYAMAVVMPRGFTESVLANPWPWLLRFGVSEFAAVLMCFVLACSITGPINELRQAARRFAGGNLQARVDPGRPWLRRRDAVAGLAYDFNDMAQRIEQHVDAQQQLLRDISHELRSPLTRLGLATGLLRKKIEAAGGTCCEEQIARMEKEMASMKGLIDNTLLAARIQEGPEDERLMQVLSTGDLLDDIIGDASFEASARGVSVTRSGPAAAIKGNAALLRSAFDNVIRNAIRYTAAGSSVDVELARAASEAVITVRDAGPGVPEASLPHLFDPFYRVEGARDRDSGGAGLGLAIARAALRAHHGSAVARNRAGGGLEVELRLPLART